MVRLRMIPGFATLIRNHSNAPSWLLPVQAHPLGTGLLSSMRLYGTDAREDDSKQPMSQKIRFVDKLRVEVSGGRGGAGVVAFSPRPGGRLVAAGGSGGNGGDVYLRATRRILSLGAVARVIAAEAGGRGGSNERSGATGTTRIVDVPVGTIVKLIEDRSAAVAAAADTDESDELWGSDDDSSDAEDEEQEEAAAQSSDDAIRMRHQGPDDGHQDDLWLQRQMAARSRRHKRQAPEIPPLPQPGQHAGSQQQQDSAAVDAGQAAADVPSRGRRRRQLLPSKAAASSAPASSAASAITAAAGATEGSAGISEPAPSQPVPHGSDASDSDAEEDAEAARQARQERWRQQAAQAVLLAEMMQEGQMLQVASGGVGGLGNMQIKGRQFHGPSKQASKGRPGSACLLLLECKTIADVGFVGLPNAGKSTLLSAMSAARAQIGSYEFTTLRPQLGALVYEDGCRLTLADIPGLIQGAHADKGRGNEFLKHIERTRVLAYIIDLSGGPHSLVTLTPAQQLAVLQNELHRYQPSLISSPSVVVANKVDSCTDAAAALAELKKHTAHPIVPVSAAHSVGLQRLKQALRMMAPPELQV